MIVSSTAATRRGGFHAVNYSRPRELLAKKDDRMSLSATTSSSSESGCDSQKLDVEALGKYAVALGTQMGLFFAIFQGIDFVISQSESLWRESLVMERFVARASRRSSWNSKTMEPRLADRNQNSKSFLYNLQAFWLQ